MEKPEPPDMSGLAKQPDSDALSTLQRSVEDLKRMEGPEDPDAAELLYARIYVDENGGDHSIATLEALVNMVKRERDILAREKIPAILNEYGLSEIRLASGEKVVVKDELHPSIAGKNYASARNGIIAAYESDGLDHDAAVEITDSLFKDALTISGANDNIKQSLLDGGIPFDEKLSIHYQTLKKYCKERRGEGKTIPEPITVFEYQEAKIKTK